MARRRTGSTAQPARDLGGQREQCLVSGYAASGGIVLRTLDRGATWQYGRPARHLRRSSSETSRRFGPNQRTDPLDPAPAPTRGSTARRTAARPGRSSSRTTSRNAFYDCMTFFNKKVGLAISDPPDGLKFRVIKTTDGGQTWNVVDPAGMPAGAPRRVRASQPAASASRRNHGRQRLVRHRRVSSGTRLHLLATGAGPGPISATPLNSGPTAGINALAFQQPAARSRSRRRLRRADHVRRTTSPPRATAAASLDAAHRRAGRVPRRARPGSTATRRSPSGSPGSDVTRNKRPHVDRLRRRQPPHSRLREPERLLGLGRQRPRRVSDPLVSRSRPTASISTS